MAQLMKIMSMTAWKRSIKVTKIRAEKGSQNAEKFKCPWNGNKICIAFVKEAFGFRQFQCQRKCLGLRYRS